MTTRSSTPSRSLIILHGTVGVAKKDGEEPLRMLHVCSRGHQHVFRMLYPSSRRGGRVIWCAGGLVVRCGAPERLPAKTTWGRVVISTRSQTDTKSTLTDTRSNSRGYLPYKDQGLFTTLISTLTHTYVQRYRQRLYSSRELLCTPTGELLACLLLLG